jgi:1-deoxy-D-xylulose-5-phosphate reductoisomerase
VIRVAILGSTGSIGRSALEVIQRHPGHFQVVALAANRSLDRLSEQVSRVGAAKAVLVDGSKLRGRDDLPSALWMDGREALLELTRDPGVDVVVNALVGSAGLGPTLSALEAGKRLALANKESLVAGGSWWWPLRRGVAVSSSRWTRNTAPSSSAWRGTGWNPWPG